MSMLTQLSYWSANSNKKVGDYPEGSAKKKKSLGPEYGGN